MICLSFTGLSFNSKAKSCVYYTVLSVNGILLHILLSEIEIVLVKSVLSHKGSH